MDFATWFNEHYLRDKPGGKPGEKEERIGAMRRFAEACGVSWMTVLRAVQGKRVSAKSSEAIAGHTDGAVDKTTLCFGASDAKQNGDAA